MIDILKEAREYTREEFLNEAAKCGSLFLCPRYSGLNQKCLSIVYDEKKCKECWREAVKDITFKSEEFTAICINDKTTRDKRIKMLGITEGKEYQVKPSRYANYYELVNDLGQVETYFMDRFKIIEKPVMEVGGIKVYKNGDFDISISKEEYEKGVEGDKIEDKTIKVRCIDAKGTIVLEKNKIYTVKKEYESSYLLEEIKNHGYQFDKARFEKVEDVLMVECIANKKYVYDNITIGKEYEVLEKGEKTYKIINNNDDEAYYMKDCFKPVEPQKEVKEYSVMELLDFPVGTKFKSENTIVEVAECAKDNKVIILSGAYITSGIRVTTANRDYKFTLVEEPTTVTTAEAFKALEEGKTIESVISRAKYFKNDNGNILYAEITEDEDENAYIGFEELEGQWIIHE